MDLSSLPFINLTTAAVGGGVYVTAGASWRGNVALLHEQNVTERRGEC